MSLVELHPERLFDALRAGRLSAAERSQLEAHCARCSVCLFELQFVEASPLEQAPSAADRAYGEAAFDHVLRAKSAKPVRATRWGLLGLPLGGLLLAGAVGFAWLSTQPRAETTRAIPPITTTAPQPLEAVPPTLEVSRDTIDEPAPAVRPSANQLLAAARRARSNGRAQRAEQLYRQVIDGYAASAAAGTAQVALGRLLFEEQQPSAAVKLLDGYLQRRSNAALAEEALFYRALSLASLGEARKARASLRQLLSDFPDSLYAAPARARLAASERAE